MTRSNCMLSVAAAALRSIVSTWCDPRDCSPPGSPVRAISRQATRAKDKNRLKIEGLKKVLHAKITKRAEAAVFNSRKGTKDTESYYILIKGSIQQEDTAIVNTHAPDKPFKHTKQKGWNGRDE